MGTTKIRSNNILETEGHFVLCTGTTDGIIPHSTTGGRIHTMETDHTGNTQQHPKHADRLQGTIGINIIGSRMGQCDRTKRTQNTGKRGIRGNAKQCTEKHFSTELENTGTIQHESDKRKGTRKTQNRQKSHPKWQQNIDRMKSSARRNQVPHMWEERTLQRVKRVPQNAHIQTATCNQRGQ